MIRRWMVLIVLTAAITAGAATWLPTLDDTPNGHTASLGLSITLQPPLPARVVIDLDCMDESVWRVERPVAAQATALGLTLAPTDFEPLKPGKTGAPLSFSAVTKVVVTTDGEKSDGIGQVACTWADGTAASFPWEQDPDPAGVEEGVTWWPGVYRNNGGHFAWRHEPNGLLINNVSFNHIDRDGFYVKDDRTKGTFQFNFGIPGALGPQEQAASSNPYAADHIEADWTSVRWSRRVKTQPGPEYTQELRYSILAPGIQVETDAPSFEVSFQNGKAQKGPGGIALSTTGGPKILTPKDGIEPEAMLDNWLVLLADDGSYEIPIQLVFQHRPDRLEWTPNGLTIHRAQGVGTLAIATPYGAGVLARGVLKDWQSFTQGLPVEQRFNKIRDLLTAYPWKCRETFAVTDSWVHIRNQFDYLPWQDDWGTTPKQYAPVPPLVAYLYDLNNLPVECVKSYDDFHIPTKWGPYWVRSGSLFDYRLPIPQAWDYAPLAVQPTEETQPIFDNLMNSLTSEALDKLRRESPTPVLYPHYAAHDFLAGAWRSANFMSPERRAALRQISRQSVLSALFPQDYRYRRDPITGAQYLACTAAWRHRDEINGDGIADTDFWQGLTLYGLYTEAKYAADWETMRNHWPIIRGMASYWEALHSWALMGPGARESGDAYNADMATAGYAGLIGFRGLAQQLGTPYQRDLAAYLLAKNAVPMAAKFGFKPYALRLKHQEAKESTGECTGFGELWVASFPTVTNDIHDNQPGDPWWQTGCIGPQSVQFETHDLLMKRDPDALRTFEDAFMKNCPDAGLITREPTRVIPHLYLRTWLDADLRTSALEFLKGYQKTYMLRDAHVIAGILAWDCPVRLVDWAPAYIEAAAWDDANRKAEIHLEVTPDKATTKLAVTIEKCTLTLDGAPVTATTAEEWKHTRLLTVDVPQGKHVLTVAEDAN